MTQRTLDITLPMQNISVWFDSLHLVFKCLIIFACLPALFFMMGVVVFLQEQPGESFWGTDKPKFWIVVFGTTMIGAIASLILGAIFGLTFLLFGFFERIGFASGWSWGLAFTTSLIGILATIIYFIEIRSHK